MPFDRRIELIRAGAFVFTALLSPAVAGAQEPIVPLQLSFSDPGARSLGFGGAFVALADDATAALANPAGLVQLITPEVSVEGRRWSYSTPFTERGRVEGSPSGFGIDTQAGLKTAESRQDVSALSFLSVVFPWKNWSLALFRHQLADFEFRSETRGLFGGGSTCCQTRFFDQQARTDLTLVTLGSSAGFRVGERLALGIGLQRYEISLDAEAVMYLPDVSTPAGILGPTVFVPERSLLRVRNSSTGSDWALSAGFLWRATERWTVGGVYKQGPDLELVVEAWAGLAGDFGVPPGTLLMRVPGVDLELPDLLGLGFAFRTRDDRLTLSFQWDLVEYSSIVESLRLDDVAIDDVAEIHLGGEYVFLGSTPIVALRLGAWLDPDHQFRSTSEDPFLRALLPRGKDEIHLSAGLGLAFRGHQIDLGVDLADRVDSVSLSIIIDIR